ncbi:MAG TPA: hypothetical protein DDW23_02410 [Planctomycetes bacterium]|nr:hypothetical protein [Planctomycetota bacterium]
MISPLRKLPTGVRAGLTGLALTLLGGYAASVAYIQSHHSKKDEEPGLSMDDLVGAYHGVDREAPLRVALESAHGEEHLPDEALRKLMISWLSSERISENFESVDLGEFSPAEILEMNCTRCHAKGASEGSGIGNTLPLEYWEDVRRAAFPKRLDPVPIEILTISTHAHALTLPLVALLAGVGLLLTRWSRRFQSQVFAAMGVGLFLDIAGWWFARASEIGVLVLLAAGAAFGLAFVTALCAILADIWLPVSSKQRESQATSNPSQGEPLR